MRVGLGISVFAHVALLGFGFVAFPDAEAFKPEAIEALPVDLVTVSDVTISLRATGFGDPAGGQAAAQGRGEGGDRRAGSSRETCGEAGGSGAPAAGRSPPPARTGT
jgi:hypothetical protein